MGNFSYNNGTGIWQLGSLNSSSSASLVISASINSSGVYNNVAQVSASDLLDPDSMVNNDDGDQSEDDEDNITPNIQVFSTSAAISNTNTQH